MSIGQDLVRSPEPEVVLRPVKFVGGTTAVTKVWGRGVTVTYISTGIVDIKWADNPGVLMGVAGHCFEATTVSALKGYTVVAGVISTSTNTIRINITNASDTLADLAALQWVTLTFAFKMSGSGV